MNLCASCGIEIPPALTICVHHHHTDPEWARANRIMCDFLHRGIVPRRLPVREREDSRRDCLIEIAA